LSHAVARAARPVARSVADPRVLAYRRAGG